MATGSISRSRGRGKLKRCPGCGQRFHGSDLVTVQPERHDNLVFFDFDKVCKSCARKNAVEF